MRALQITNLSGPRSALEPADLPEPEPSHPLTPGTGVVVDVHAAGVSFPEVLQTRGEYQLKPPLPFVPGSEVGGRGAQRARGRRLSAGRPRGRVLHARRVRRGRGGARRTSPSRCPDGLDFAQGAALILNYHTAYFALKLRGRLAEGETVLVHGAAGGVGTAALQVAKGLGARTIAVVSSDEKERGRARGGRRRGRALRRRVEGRGEGALRRRRRRGARPGRRRPLHRQPALAARGRPRSWSSASPAARSPRCKVNRLLLNNIEVVGAGWGAYVMGKPEVNREIGAELGRLIERGLRAARSSARASRSSRRPTR